MTEYTEITRVNEELEDCLSANCSAVCNQDDGETWECCSCSLGIPPPGEPIQSVTVSVFFWWDDKCHKKTYFVMTNCFVDNLTQNVFFCF